jgi:polar amino acid transport system substrate-binding protein
MRPDRANQRNNSELRDYEQTPASPSKRAAVPALIAAALVPLTVCASCGSLPRDPEHTLEHVIQRKHVRIGLIENTPWVIHAPEGPRGAEVMIIQRFAASLGAAPDWFWGGEEEHMEALRHFELDLAIGGIASSTPWSKTIGLTRPYFVERVVVGVPARMPVPDSLKGLRVEVLDSESAPAYLKRKSATPVPVSEGTQVSGPLAAPEWRIWQLGLKPTKFELLTIKHVVAAPPGENAWLKRLQEFLSSQSSQLPSLLQTSGTQ